MCILYSLSTERRGFRPALDFISSQRPVLTLQHEDLSDQHLRIHQLRKHVHGRVHQAGTEDGEELLPDSLSLLPPAGILLCPMRRLPARALSRQAADPRRTSPERNGPVLLLLAAVGSAVLEICRLTVRVHADWVCAIAGVMRWAVAADGPKAVLLVVESWCGPLRGRAM